MSNGRKQFAVYRLKKGFWENEALRYRSWNYLQKFHVQVQADRYEQICVSPFSWELDPSDLCRQLENGLPAASSGEKLEVSDVLAVTKDGITTAYYVDPEKLIALTGFFHTTASTALLSIDTTDYQIEGRDGNFLAADEIWIDGQHFFLMQSQQFGKNAAYVVLDSNGKVAAEDTVISHFLFHGLTLLSIKLKEDTARRNLTHSLTDYSVQCLFMISLSMSQKRQQATTLAKSACCLTTTWLSPAMPCKTMILISVKDYNQFSQDYYESIINSLQFHQLTCTCGHSSCLSVHGYYTRGIILPDGKHFLRICRVKCSECGKTHALLLTSIVPYDRISLSDQHTIVCAFENGTDKYAVCEDNPSLDESNVRSVIRRYCLYWLQRLLAEKISLSAIPSLIRECLAAYSMQFMQIHRTEAVLFVCTT